MRLTFLALALFAASAVAAPEVGKPAPAFSLPGSDGRTHALADHRGKYVVLEWTNHDCPFVKKHYASGNMQAQQKFFARKGAVWLSIVSSAPGKQGHVDAARARELTESRGAAPAAVLLDPRGDVGRAYGARTTPHMFLIDPQGTLLYMGGIDSIPSADPADIEKATPYLKVAFAEAAAGKPVSEPSTRPYGCAVKYD
jgi:peroxiredoxin